MNGDYDGSITIKTAIDTSGFVAGEKDLAKSAQDAVGKIEGIGDAARRSLERQVENFSRMNDAYRQQAETVEQLRAQLEELRETEVLTPEAEALIDEYKRTGEQVDKLKAKMQKMEDMYGEEAATGKSAYQSLNYDLSRLVERYEDLSEIMEKIDSGEDGSYWTKADTSIAEQKLSLAEEKQALMLDRLNSKYKDLRANVAKASETTTKAHKQMGEEGEKAFDRVTKKSSLSFKNILKYVVGVQTIYAMFNKIKRAANEGLQIVAQYDPQFNEVMSTMKTGISQLKADIGAMLQPILQTIVPILNMVLERLHSALTKVANVIAAIMGQDYIDVVTVKAENYAGALDNVASSAKAAAKALGGYDKLNVIQSESSGGGGGVGGALAGLAGAGNGAKYERLPIELSETWQKVVDVIHEAQNETEEYIDAYADEGVTGVVQKFIDNVKYTLDNQEWVTIKKGSIADKIRNFFVGAGKAFGNALDPAGKGGTVVREGVVEKWFSGVKEDAKDVANRFLSIFGKEIGKGDVTYRGDISIPKEAAKKTMSRFGSAVEKETSDLPLKLFPSELKGKAATKLKNFSQKVGAFFTNSFSVNSDVMASTISSATASSGNDPRVNEAATTVGKQISATIASAVDFTAADTNTVTTRTKKLLSGADSVKLEAEAVGKGVADSISRGLKSTTVFSEADGKSTAGQIAKGLEAVSAEANRGGSALSNALHNIGKKISEGISKGTMSVPVTFTGQATPVAAQTNYPKVNTTVTITLDGKTISKTVFDEAERISKQTGTGARAGIHYAYSVG